MVHLSCRVHVSACAVCVWLFHELSWEQGNLFASGVNTGKLLSTLLSSTDMANEEKRAVVLAAAAEAGVTHMARRPGGAWVPCAAVPAPHLSHCVNVARWAAPAA